MLIAMAIFAIATTIIYNTYRLYAKNYSAQQNIVDMQQNARATLELMARELKKTNRITAIDCTANNSSITFASIEDAGMVSGAAPTTLTDNSKSWEANQWQRNTGTKDTVLIIGGKGSETDTGTSTGGNSSTTLNKTGAGWTVNQWTNYTVLITGGTGVGQTRTIGSNTATQLTVSTNWTTTPDNTSTYKIQQIRDISSNNATQLTLSGNWGVTLDSTPNNTSLYLIRGTRGFSRDAADNEIDYRMSGSDGATQVYAGNITGLTLQGFDSNGASIACNSALIRRLDITLTARTEDINPNTNAVDTYTVSTSVMF